MTDDLCMIVKTSLFVTEKGELFHTEM